MKKCGKCKEVKSKGEFPTSKGRLASPCKDCRKEYVAKYRKLNPQKPVNSRASKDREWLVGIKAASGCVRCGETHPACLDFHHRDQTTKTATISQVVGKWNRDRIQDELDKCDIVCVNCHRKQHFDEKTGPWTPGTIKRNKSVKP